MILSGWFSSSTFYARYLTLTAMATGWRFINGNWYYMYSSGAMAHDTYIGAYYVDSSGARVIDNIQKSMDLKAINYNSATAYLVSAK